MPASSADLRAAKNWVVLSFLFAASCACGTHRVALSPRTIDADNATPGWVDLSPGMELKVDGAYYREGSPRRRLEDYLGDEIANYEVRANGSLDLKSVSSLPAGKQPPGDQPGVQLLIGRRNASSRYHRLFFRIVNGSPRRVVWGSTIGSVATHPLHVTLLRNAGGRVGPVPVDASDPEALRLPLQHGDRITWD